MKGLAKVLPRSSQVEAKLKLTDSSSWNSCVFCFCFSSFGNVFADDVYNHGDYKYLITSNDGEKRHVTTMLIQLGGVPVIDYWLLTAHQSKRLQPLEDNLYIVANKVSEGL